MSKLNKLWDLAMEAVFPSNIYCICCGSLIERNRPYSLCDSCLEQIHWINGRSCEVCGKALPDTFLGKRCYNCMSREHVFRRGYSCMTYGLLERQMILDFKYNGKGYMGLAFGDILTDKIMSEDLNIDCIVPVPIHRQRERSRGYNQTAVMAGRMSRNTGIPWREHGCRRVRATRLLRSMTPLEREAAMKGVFQVPEYEKRYIEGMSILLIDDIITTGTTADSCAGALLDAGAQSVDLLTLAAGGNRKPSE